MMCGDWLILRASFDSESLIILPYNYFCPFPTDDMVSLKYTICQCTFVKIYFKGLMLWPGVYLEYISGIFLMFTKSRVFLPISPTCYVFYLWFLETYLNQQINAFFPVFLKLAGWNSFNCPVNTIKVMSSGSVYLAALFLGRLSPLSGVNQYLYTSFARNWQLPFFKQQKEESENRKYFTIYLDERMLPYQLWPTSRPSDHQLDCIWLSHQGRGLFIFEFGYIHCWK